MIGEISKNRYRITFVILLVILGAIFAITSDVVVLKTLEINPTVDSAKVLLVGVMVVLMSLNFTVMFHN